jgi:hypothetical protein
MKATSLWVTDNQLQEAIAKLENSGSSFLGLLDAIERYRRSAADVKDVFEWQQWARLEPSRLGGDHLRSLDALLRSVAWDLRALRHLIVFDVDQLLEQINSGLETRRFRQVVLAVRAVLERAAVTEHHFVSIRQLFSRIREFPAREVVRGALPTKEYGEHIEARYDAAMAVRRYMSRQTFNWASFDAPDGIGNISVKDTSIKQENAGRAIKQCLDWTGSHSQGRNLYWWYALLCDYVHPNMGASHLFVDVLEKIELRFPNGYENQLYRQRLTRRPDHISALTHVLTLVYLPLREALSWTTSHIDWLAAQQKKHYRDLRSFERQTAKGVDR